MARNSNQFDYTGGMDRPFYKEIKWTPGMYEPGRSNGRVFEHREIAAAVLGRCLDPQECVHHVDEDRLNNDPSNLMVFSTVADHSARHKGAALISNGDGTFRCERTSYVCDCGNSLTRGASCCLDCHRIRAASGIPAREDLEELVWMMPSTQVALLFGVSDVMVGKWCKKYDLTKPPRGYWKKLKAQERDVA